MKCEDFPITITAYQDHIKGIGLVINGTVQYDANQETYWTNRIFVTIRFYIPRETVEVSIFEYDKTSASSSIRKKIEVQDKVIEQIYSLLKCDEEFFNSVVEKIIDILKYPPELEDETS